MGNVYLRYTTLEAERHFLASVGSTQGHFQKLKHQQYPKKSWLTKEIAQIRGVQSLSSEGSGYSFVVKRPDLDDVLEALRESYILFSQASLQLKKDHIVFSLGVAE